LHIGAARSWTILRPATRLRLPLLRACTWRGWAIPRPLPLLRACTWRTLSILWPTARPSHALLRIGLRPISAAQASCRDLRPEPTPGERDQQCEPADADRDPT
jgi:hypothetical protein